MTVLLSPSASDIKKLGARFWRSSLHYGAVLCTCVRVGRCGPQHLEVSVRLLSEKRTRPQLESAPYACDWRAAVVAKQSCSSCAK